MGDVKSGILSGVKISEDNAEVMAKVADKIRELDNGVLDPEEVALGDIMGASASVEEEIKQGASALHGDGTQVADHGVLTGVEISEDKAEILEKVTETIEDVEAFEAGAAKDEAIGKVSDTLAAAMGVKPE